MHLTQPVSLYKELTRKTASERLGDPWKLLKIKGFGQEAGFTRVKITAREWWLLQVFTEPILTKDPPFMEITVQLEVLSLTLSTSCTPCVSLLNIKVWKKDWDTVKYVLKREPDQERHVLDDYLINSTVLLVIVMPMT